METDYSRWKKRVQSVPLTDIVTTKQSEFMAVRASFQSLHSTIAKLAPEERDRVLVVLAEDLQQIALMFSAAVATRISSQERKAACAYADSDELFTDWRKVLRESFGLET